MVAVVFTDQLYAAVEVDIGHSTDTTVPGALDGIGATVVIVAYFIGIHDVEVTETLVVEVAAIGHRQVLFIEEEDGVLSGGEGEESVVQFLPVESGEVQNVAVGIALSAGVVTPAHHVEFVVVDQGGGRLAGGGQVARHGRQGEVVQVDVVDQEFFGHPPQTKPE